MLLNIRVFACKENQCFFSVGQFNVVYVVVPIYLCFKIFQTSLISISFVSGYNNEFETMKNKF